MLSLEEELNIIKKVYGKNKIVTNPHQNVYNGTDIYNAHYNQGVSKVKLKEFVEKENISFEDWKKK